MFAQVKCGERNDEQTDRAKTIWPLTLFFNVGDINLVCNDSVCGQLAKVLVRVFMRNPIYAFTARHFDMVHFLKLHMNDDYRRKKHNGTTKTCLFKYSEKLTTQK